MIVEHSLKVSDGYITRTWLILGTHGLFQSIEAFPHFEEVVKSGSKLLSKCTPYSVYLIV